MKAILVKDILSLTPDVVYLRESYPKGKGVYLVDDDTVYTLVNIDSDNVMGITIPLPRDSVVKEYERIGEPDIGLLQKQLSELNKTMNDTLNAVEAGETNLETIFNALDADMRDGLNELGDKLLSQNGGSSSMDLASITKLIAVAQKPDLIKEKIK